jgi:hypothetical protein
MTVQKTERRGDPLIEGPGAGRRCAARAAVEQPSDGLWDRMGLKHHRGLTGMNRKQYRVAV